MAVSKNIKTKQLENLKTQLKGAKSFVLIDYTGLKVNQVNDLRARLDSATAIMTVAKNSLLEKAMELKEVLKGQTAVVSTETEDLTIFKVLAAFAKEFEALKFKLGHFDGKTINETEIKALAMIPSRQGLLSQFVWSLTGLETKLVVALSEIAKKRN
ncbi:MAG: 50S ribosomal protein L10 [candidate division WWE3 bacterium]|nr:50S ribosomal protein L10 [candidate division WWE3 bacterium]